MRRQRIAWLPLLLGLYLLAIIAYLAVTRGATLLAGQLAYPATLAVVGLGALLAIAWGLLGRRRG